MLCLPIFLPLIGGLSLLFFTPKSLKVYCFSITLLTALLVVISPFLCVSSIQLGQFPLGVSLTLRIDEISIFFSWIFAGIWLFVLQYSFGYLADDPNQKRFFAFFLAVLGALIGVSYADNLVTLYMFFECVSLTCFPLIAHQGTEESIKACKKYIFYSIGGALMGLISIFYFYALGLGGSFVAGGMDWVEPSSSPLLLQGLLCVGIIGFGCKSGLFPLQGWLKTAHPIAPAPASAVLSGITTKVGVIAILRMIYYVLGPAYVQGTTVQTILLAITLLTIFLGSMLAYREKILKTRLAYSTVSQLSYILFSLLLCNKIAFIGALLHVLFHALAKNALFLSAGTIIHETGIHRTDELRGLGASLKPTFLLFAIASLSLVGVPFFGGFVSKWYIAIGALEHTTLGIPGVAIVMISALLTAGYLLPIVTDGLFSCCGDNPSPQPPKSMTAPALGVPTILLGIYPAPVIQFISAIADKLF